jgi:hypothetical protein
MNIGDCHKNNEQRSGMLINDLLDIQTTLHIVNEAVLINKHDRGKAVGTAFRKPVYAINIVDVSLLDAPAG